MSDRPSMRVLSYNVHRWADDREALARVVKACAPDVALIQEAVPWCGTRRQREAMAASFGLRYAAGRRHNAILVADGTDLTESRDWRVGRPFVRRPFLRRNLRLIATQLPGEAVGGRVDLGGKEIALVVCHLGLDTRGRQHELDQILAHCRSFGTPYLLMGDLNEEPGGWVWNRLAEECLSDLGMHGGPTFHSGNPLKRIDAALISPGITGRLIALESMEGLTRPDLAAASDHLPLLVQLDPAP
jgi:endonuclease/exonuclease/phosphatase family metal-dependent hydrolase